MVVRFAGSVGGSAVRSLLPFGFYAFSSWLLYDVDVENIDGGGGVRVSERGEFGGRVFFRFVFPKLELMIAGPFFLGAFLS
jgi:hypothetical protein